MIYRSNLAAPDLAPCFEHGHSRVMGQSFGHDVISDWADKPDDDPFFGIYRQCGFWTHDEAAILYHVAKVVGGRWADIGGHTGWTAAHIALAGTDHVDVVEPMYVHMEWRERLVGNLTRSGLLEGQGLFDLHAERSDEFWPKRYPESFDGVVIDGDHGAPRPLEDALAAARVLKPRGVAMFHDATGGPVQDAVRAMRDLGFTVTPYATPHLVVACHRGDIALPEHVPGPGMAKHMQPYIELLA
jgi:hypothetical protein